MAKYPINNILLFNPYGIGNTILLIPFLRNLRDHYPDAKIQMVITQRVVEDLLEGQDLIDIFCHYENSSSPKKNRSFNISNLKRYLSRISKLMVWVKRSAADIVFIPEQLTWKTALFILGSRARLSVCQKGDNWFLDKIPSHSVSVRDGVHEVEWWLDLLRPLENDVRQMRPSLVLSKENKNYWAERYFKMGKGRKIIGIHPGCSNALHEKRWPVDRYCTLIKALKEKMGFFPIVFGGPDDIDVSDAIMQKLKIKFMNYTNRLSILDTATAVSQCDLFISNDSGLMHVAASVGTPIIALFGDTNVTKNSPLITDSVVLDGGKMNSGSKLKAIDRITSEDVLAAIKLIQNRKSA